MKRKDDPAISGVLLVDKPAGMTSHDVVGRVRKTLGIRRVGHAGTLDPMATGVLVLGVGPATRLLGIVGAHDKEYLATIRLGIATTTDDAEGDVIAVCEPSVLADVDECVVVEGVAALTGDIEQRPSSVSAVKVNGKRAYERVRSGEEVELPTRRVRISHFDVLDIERSSEWVDVRVRVECSAGTYIRALARDLGGALGVGGHLTELRRTRSGAVRVTECIDLDEVSRDRLMRPGAFARMELASVDITDADAVRARHGSVLSLTLPDAPVVALIGPGDDLVAAVEPGPRYLAVFPASSHSKGLSG